MAGVSFLDGPPRLPSPFMGARNKSGHDVGGGRHACLFSVMPGLVPGTHGLQHGGMRGGWVYIMTNRPNGTLYLGVTGNIARRAWEHREGMMGRAAPGVPLRSWVPGTSPGMTWGGATPAFFPSCPDLFRASTGCSMTPPVGGYSG